MSLKTTIESDLKTAMLAGDKTLVTTLRGLKSAILNVEVEKGLREAGLPDEEIVSLLQKEAKKRQESADFYVQGGSQDRAAAELAEKLVIEKYLPAQLSEEELRTLVDEVVNGMGSVTTQQMGQVIGAVKAKAGAAGDGATIARLVKEKVSS
jgi:uncharacterized protein YqeY